MIVAGWIVDVKIQTLTIYSLRRGRAHVAKSADYTPYRRCRKGTYQSERNAINGDCPTDYECRRRFRQLSMLC